jgi:hypothetical protein
MEKDDSPLLTGRIVRKGTESMEKKGHTLGIQFQSEGRNSEILAEWLQTIKRDSGVDSAISQEKR